MNRILPEQVKAAYEATGLTPHRGWYYDPFTNNACGLGVCVVEKYRERDVKYSEGFAAILTDEFGISTDYRLGFANGFDGEGWLAEQLGVFSEEQFNQGVEDGKAAWALVSGAAA